VANFGRRFAILTQGNVPGVARDQSLAEDASRLPPAEAHGGDRACLVPRLMASAEPGIASCLGGPVGCWAFVSPSAQSQHDRRAHRRTRQYFFYVLTGPEPLGGLRLGGLLRRAACAALSRARQARKLALGRQGGRCMGEPSTVKRALSEARQQRLAARLRANLAKRKVQARARAAAERASVHQVADNPNEKGR